jgi:hypothetical protein
MSSILVALDHAQSGRGEPVDEFDLGRCIHHGRFTLQTIARTDLDQFDGVRIVRHLSHPSRFPAACAAQETPARPHTPLPMP